MRTERDPSRRRTITYPQVRRVGNHRRCLINELSLPYADASICAGVDNGKSFLLRGAGKTIVEGDNRQRGRPLFGGDEGCCELHRIGS